MSNLKVEVDGKAVSLSARQGGDDVFVQLDAFCELIDAEAIKMNGGPLSVCRDDLCIPLNIAGNGDTLTVDGALFGRLAAFGESLGLKWQVSNSMLIVNSGQSESLGLGIGHRPPLFTLSDLYTGEPVSLSDFQGKKTAFYMWASW